MSCKIVIIQLIRAIWVTFEAPHLPPTQGFDIDLFNEIYEAVSLRYPAAHILDPGFYQDCTHGFSEEDVYFNTTPAEGFISEGIYAVFEIRGK